MHRLRQFQQRLGLALRLECPPLGLHPLCHVVTHAQHACRVAVGVRRVQVAHVVGQVAYRHHVVEILAPDGPVNIADDLRRVGEHVVYRSPGQPSHVQRAQAASAHHLKGSGCVGAEQDQRGTVQCQFQLGRAARQRLLLLALQRQTLRQPGHCRDQLPLLWPPGPIAVQAAEHHHELHPATLPHRHVRLRPDSGLRHSQVSATLSAVIVDKDRGAPPGGIPEVLTLAAPQPARHQGRQPLGTRRMPGREDEGAVPVKRHQTAQVHVADRGAQGHRPQQQVVEAQAQIAQAQVAQLRNGLQGFRLGQGLTEIFRQQFMGAALPLARDGEQPQFEFVHHQSRQISQGLLLGGRQGGVWGAVQQTQRADDVAVRRHERHPGVEAHAVARDERTLLTGLVLSGIGNDQRLTRLHHHAAQLLGPQLLGRPGAVFRQLDQLQAARGPPPLPLLVHE